MFIYENAFKYVICKISPILFRLQYVKVLCDIFICIFFNEVWTFIIISLKFFPTGPIDNKAALPGGSSNGYAQHRHQGQFSASCKLRLCSANHSPGYWSNLPCDWPSTACAYSEQETKKRPSTHSYDTPLSEVVDPNL